MLRKLNEYFEFKTNIIIIIKQTSSSVIVITRAGKYLHLSLTLINIVNDDEPRALYTTSLLCFWSLVGCEAASTTREAQLKSKPYATMFSFNNGANARHIRRYSSFIIYLRETKNCFKKRNLNKI